MKLKSIVTRLDNYQRSNKPLGFIYATIKKYGDDQASYQAALLTYYGFLSLFPLLVVITSILKLALKNDLTLKTKAIAAIGHYFPAISSDLQSNIHSIHRTGLALAFGVLVFLYGSLGVAGAWMNVLNHIWEVPRLGRPGQPKTTLKQIGIITIGGLGFLLAAILSGVTTGLGHSLIFRVGGILVSLVVLFFTLLYLLSRGTSSGRTSSKAMKVSAVSAAICLQLVQTLGGYLMTHELKNLSPLYGTFAVVLGLFFWIYLQAQIILWIIEVATVRRLRLWPRGINASKPTAQDEVAYELYTRRENLSRGINTHKN